MGVEARNATVEIDGSGVHARKKVKGLVVHRDDEKQSGQEDVA